MELLDVIMPDNLENLQLPAPEAVNYWRLAENRMFYIDSEIDMSILELQKTILYINVVDKNIELENRIPIKIYIDSLGGNLTEAMSLAVVMVMSKTPIITINIGNALSAGAILFLAGHSRYALPHSIAMVHTGSGGVVGTFEQTEEWQKSYKRQVGEMGDFILQRSGMDEKVYKKNKTKDWYMSASEQVVYGLAHKIVDSLDEII